MRKTFALAGTFCALLLTELPSAAFAQGGPYVNFETIPTRALALSPDGTKLFVTNTPDGRLEILNVTPAGLEPAGSVSVGLDPVAVSARNDSEVWVVNLLSDSVSVVDVASTPARVVRTLLVGDEPRDVAFAGPNGDRAFITAVRRGQNHPANVVEETQKPSVGRAEVWVFDATRPGADLGGTPITIVQLYSDKPGALTTSPDGRTVFVAVATSGNDTTTINDAAVCGPNNRAGGAGVSNQEDGPCQLRNGGMSPGGNPGPNMNQVDRAGTPQTGIIVKLDRQTGQWRDQAGRNFADAVEFTLADNDVFAIDAMANPPAQSAAFQGVGTLNKGLAAHPTNGKLYVATIEAINMNRFLSVPRLNAFPNPTPMGGVARTADPLTGKTLNGHLYESRISIMPMNGGAKTANARATPTAIRHLNKHIDYEVVPSPAGVKERSVADPQGIAFSPDGGTLFVAGLGSNKIVPFPTAKLDDDSFTPDAATHIQLSGDGGPTDMVLDAKGEKMFVYRRFDNAVSIVDIAGKRETASVPLFSPEPPQVRAGRKFFYDATLTSSNGEANCNVCHPAADKDDLAWDLGTPFAGRTPNRNPFVIGGGRNSMFNPLKGPMTVLTLRGIKDSGPMFWRGEASSATPADERANFQNFNVVFEGLLGRPEPLPQADFDRFTDWVLTIVPPPNPYRPLDQQLNASQARGMSVYTGGEGGNDGPFNCNTCHQINAAMGFFGTSGANTAEGESQEFKVTQLRTTYDKIGMFGQNNGLGGDRRTNGGPRVNLGAQIRGTGTLHDGSQGGAEDFLVDPQFQLDQAQLKAVVDFVYAFPTNLAPVVGQQVTLRADSDADTTARVDLLEQRAAAAFVMPGNMRVTECDLVAKAVVDGQERGFLFQPQSRSFMDSMGRTVSDADLRGMARTAGQEVTFTCIYPGGGRRVALDRNMDGTLDGGAQAPAAGR